MKYIIEIMGTFFLVLTIGLSVLEPNSAKAMAPVAIASALISMIYAGGHISGAHYNPAVSLAIYIRGGLSFFNLIAYWIAQIIGAAKAAFITLYLKGGPAPLGLDINVPKVFLSEFIFTLALCFVMLVVARAKKTAGNDYFGVAIGLVVVAGAYAVGPISGAAFNPAVALGIAILEIIPYASLWIYATSALCAALLAAIIFKFAERQ